MTASRSARTAAARPSTWRGGRTARPVGAAKPAGRISRLRSGTLFAFHKMPLRSYLMAVAIFCNEVKGKSMLALSRDLGTQYKTAFVLAHKMREAMAAESRGAACRRTRRKAEVDGGYFGGYVKPANHRENRRDRRLRMNQSGKRKVVVVIRERDGKTLPGVFRNEADALTFIRNRVAPQTELYADEAGSWNELPARFTLHRINHQEAYSLRDGRRRIRTTPRASLAACAGPKSGTTTMSPART